MDGLTIQEEVTIQTTWLGECVRRVPHLFTEEMADIVDEDECEEYISMMEAYLRTRFAGIADFHERKN